MILLTRRFRSVWRRRMYICMQLTYDPRHNTAYLRLQEKINQVETIRVSEELPIDLAPDSAVYGIELLNTNQQLHAENRGKLVVINEAAGDRREIDLA